MAREARSRDVDAKGVTAFRRRADELALEMEVALQGGRPLAAAVVAVQCAIASADAVCGRTLGKRAAGEDHDEAAKLLEASPSPNARKKAEQLRRILDLKYAAEYEDRNLTGQEARDLVERARRFHAWMNEILAAARP